MENKRIFLMIIPKDQTEDPEYETKIVEVDSCNLYPIGTYCFNERYETWHKNIYSKEHPDLNNRVWRQFFYDTVPEHIRLTKDTAFSLLGIT